MTFCQQDKIVSLRYRSYLYWKESKTAEIFKNIKSEISARFSNFNKEDEIFIFFP